MTGLRNGSMFLGAVGSCADVYLQHHTKVILQVIDSSKFKMT